MNETFFNRRKPLPGMYLGINNIIIESPGFLCYTNNNTVTLLLPGAATLDIIV